MKIKSTLTLFMLILIIISSQSFSQTPGWAWAHSAGGTFSDAGKSTCADGLGNVYVTGYFRSPSLTYGAFTLTNADATSATTDMFIVKYDAFGSVQWAQRIGGIGDEQGNGVSVDNENNVYVTGSFSSPTINIGANILTNINTDTILNNDIFIVKYNSVGSILWAKSAGGYGDDIANGITTNIRGCFYFTGTFESDSITFDTTSYYNSGSLDIFIAKYDTLGNALWVKTAGGIYEDNSTSISSDTSGNAAITGYFFSNSINFGGITLNKIDTTVTDTVGYASDVFVAKYDAAGNVLWAKSAGGKDTTLANNDNVSSNGVAMDNHGNVYVTGYFRYDSITFGSLRLIDTTRSRDIFIVKYDTAGTALWAKQAGDILDDEGRGITVDAAGNVLITGYYQYDTINFENITLTGTNFDSEIFVVKYDSSGTVLWAKSAGGNYGDYGNSINTFQNNNVYITGQYYSSSISFGPFSISNAAPLESDIFTAKLHPFTVEVPASKTSNNELIIYPNPTSSFSIISYSLKTATNVTIEIYNEIGAKVSSLITNEKQNEGTYQYKFTAQQSGIYFIKMQTSEGVLENRVIFTD